MSKSDKKIEDEPGAEDRFLSGVRKALTTPPKPFTPKKASADQAKAVKGKASSRSKA